MHSEKTFDRTKFVGALIIPVVIGRNRLRGNSQGAMVDEESWTTDSKLHELRKQLRVEAERAGVEPTTEWLKTCVGQVLALYEKAESEWLAKKDGTLAHVYEGALPSGRVLVMAKSDVLRRLDLH